MVFTEIETLPLDYSPAGFIIYMKVSAGLWLQAGRPAEDEPRTHEHWTARIGLARLFACFVIWSP